MHGGCVEDVWCAVSATLNLFPECEGHVGLLGISFGGGIGAMALACDTRIQRAHFNVPSFGNQPLRMTFPTGVAARRFGRGSESRLWSSVRLLIMIPQYPPVVYRCRCMLPVLFDPMVAPPDNSQCIMRLRGRRSSLC